MRVSKFINFPHSHSRVTTYISTERSVTECMEKIIKSLFKFLDNNNIIQKIWLPNWLKRHTLCFLVAQSHFEVSQYVLTGNAWAKHVYIPFSMILRVGLMWWDWMTFTLNLLKFYIRYFAYINSYFINSIYFAFEGFQLT